MGQSNQYSKCNEDWEKCEPLVTDSNEPSRMTKLEADYPSVYYIRTVSALFRQEMFIDSRSGHIRSIRSISQYYTPDEMK